ncbi:hypothetical protein L596_010733 [Steinernema carpocapsae]|uniref:Phytanoyl-CoA hydroxylase-interacting protein-like C-terminal domain-containing protein n=1 Tax=Steinernema carpocapsae TaxID=34508 RepID=A0A4U5PJE6_STECR|nr:hypothetical protein L596_010733 [Steinernema carpocapsae]
MTFRILQTNRECIEQLSSLVCRWCLEMYSFERENGASTSSRDGYLYSFPVGPNLEFVHEITFDIDVSSVECVIRWSHVEFANVSDENAGFKATPIYCLEILGGPTPIYLKLPYTQRSYRLFTLPGNFYEVNITCLVDVDEILARGREKFKAVFNKSEMKKLYDKAVENSRDVRRQIFALYRCKPKDFFDEAYRNVGIMEPYVKDENGQAGSPINGAINGLFFSARVLPDGSIPESSPFGEVRMIIPAFKLLNPETMKFYFSDYYCNYTLHYVTIVVCLKGSGTDRYALHLITLKPEIQVLPRKTHPTA